MDKTIAGNFFLIGLMGAGKTTLGKLLSQHLSYPFFDSDYVICERTGVSIPTIFELEGENGFRHRETQIIDELTQMNSIVLATGGGAVLRSDNRKFLRERGTVIYLHAQPDLLWNRTQHDRNRPLLQVADPLTRLNHLYQERDSLYRSVAHLVVNLENESGIQSFDRLKQQLEQFYDAQINR